MKEFISGILSRLQNEFDPEIIGGSMVALVANIIVGVLTFMAFYVLWVMLDYVVRFFIKKTDIDKTTISFIETLRAARAGVQKADGRRREHALRDHPTGSF